LERGRIVFDAKNSNLWLNRLLRELVWAWRLIRSNIAQGAVLAGLIIIATLLGGFAFSTSVWFQKIQSTALSQLQTVVFIDKSLPQEEIQSIRADFVSRPGVAEVTFVSSEQALAELRLPFPSTVGCSKIFPKIPYRLPLKSGLPVWKA